MSCRVVEWFLMHQKLTDTHHGQSHAVTILHSVVGYKENQNTIIRSSSYSYSGFPGGTSGKESACRRQKIR